MQRLRGYDVLNSRVPGLLGLCSNDRPRVYGYLQSAQRRLVMAKEAGDEGWWGTWAEIAFNLDPTKPYVSFGPHVARVEAFNVCNRTVPIHNQFYEYLEFGNGRADSLRSKCPGSLNWYERGNSVTSVRMTTPPQLIVAYATDPADMQIGSPKRVFIQGLDANNNPIYAIDGTTNQRGIYLTLQSPFVVSPFPLMALTGIQKDVTYGQVQIMQQDTTTGIQTLLLTMEPWETTAWYRTYQINPPPNPCCQTSPVTTTVPVSAIVKLELTPVVADTDYCLIQNLEALIEEMCAVRYSEMDTLSSKQLEGQKHQKAIGLLNGELCHYLGMDNVAVNFRPFGSARLERQCIGTML